MTTRLLDVDMAHVNVTYRGLSGDLVDPVRRDASSEEVIAFAEEAIRGGSVRGMPADPNARLVGYHAGPPLEPDAEAGRTTYTFIVRPKTGFGR